jgi:hypothetical protein
LVSVNDSRPQTNPSIEPTPEECKLLCQLRANPAMAVRFGLIMERFEQEVAGGADANEAEEMLIEEMGRLGKVMLGEWAKSSQGKAIAQAKGGGANVTEHAKKNSAGIRPSERSS